MNPTLRTATPADAPRVSALVQAVFAGFVAPDWAPEARAAFAGQSSGERFEQLLQDPAFAAVAEAGGQLLGFILLPTPDLLAFLFVDGQAHKRGIATALWQAAREHLEAAYPDTKTVELNSSPYAVPAYRALGFYPISEPFRRGGAVATRMACWLPGKALSEAQGAG